MAGCQINGRLWYELYRNTPLSWLWKFVEHTPSGDSLMRGPSYQVIQQRIVELSGMDPAEVSRECDRLRAIKLKEDRAVKLVTDKWERCGEGGGGGWSCSILEDNLFADPIT